MKTISGVLGEAVDGSLWFFCNGSDMPHSLNVGEGPGPHWGYNRKREAPTFTPSILARYQMHGGEIVCHSFITDGRIQYLGDCTHSLAGQTVDLPNWGESWAKW